MSNDQLLVELLIKAKIIPQGFTGQVILHIGQGGLCDVERYEKGLKKLLNDCNSQEGKSNGKMG